MELKDQIIQEYLASGCGYRNLQKKYGISRTTICKWVQVYQGIHNLVPTDLQQKHFINPMERKEKNSQDASSQKSMNYFKKIASLKKQLAHQQLKSFLSQRGFHFPKQQSIINKTPEMKPRW